MDNVFSMTLDNMKFSYSSVTSFITCPLMFKLTYLDYNERGHNWFSDFGLLMHEVLEKYFKGELEIMELSQYYEKQYPLMVTSPSPPYPAGIADRYYADGLEFFDTFDLDRNDYEIISIEDTIYTEHNDIKLVIKPDLVVKEKSTGDIILIDYKTSNPFSKDGKPDKKKMADYHKQMYLYSYFINHNRDYKINKIRLWFVRINKFDEFDYNEDDAGDVVNWFYNGILNIKFAEEFPPADYAGKNKFFCEQLCGVKASCPYLNGEIAT